MAVLPAQRPHLADAGPLHPGHAGGEMAGLCGRSEQAPPVSADAWNLRNPVSGSAGGAPAPHLRLDSALGTDAGHLLHQWENLAYTAAFVSAAVLLFTHPGLPLPSRLLSSAGKCTLTCYVSQTLVFTFLFFGWGLGLAQGMGPWACLCAAVARLPASSLGVPPLASPLPVRPPGMAVAHRHHVPHAAVPQAHAIGRAALLPPCVCQSPVSPEEGGIKRMASCVRSAIKPFLS